MTSAPRGSSALAIQPLRAARGVAVEMNQVERASSSSAASGRSTAPLAITMWQPAAIACLAAAIFVTIPPAADGVPTSPAIASICGVMRSTTGIHRASGSCLGSVS